MIDRFREIYEPVGYLDVFIVVCERVMVGLPYPLDRVGERY
jgi:hypothetical protein